MNNMARLESIVAELPEARRVDIEEWGGHPTFRVGSKSFVFSDGDAHHISLKLPHDEAAALVASDPAVSPAGYGLGRHGWVAIDLLAEDEAGQRWVEVAEWVRMSYCLIAPKRLARQVDPSS
jgi:predicted DNA-binding protein (MmcQ/YjbR family)